MKTSFIISICLVASCNNVPSDETRRFIPGMYVKAFEQEYSKGNDTLIITRVSKDGNNYRIIKRAGYRRILDGKTLPKEYSNDMWTAIYDEKLKVLNELKKGRVLSFIPEKQILLVGSSEYRKINTTNQ